MSSSYLAPHTPDAIAVLAERHGLDVDAGTVRLNEAGLDYRVAYADTADGTTWVLRVPRRAGMGESIAAEAVVLELVGAHLDVAVPQWRVANEDLVAYPLLPGSPALTLEEGQPVFHVDVASPTYAQELGRLLGTLHSIPTGAALEAGLAAASVADVRAKHGEHLAEVADAFTIADDLLTRWNRWLDTDSYWPQHTTMTHGEPYQAHVLVDSDDRITGVLDWTTAAIDDPARDLTSQHLTAPPEIFELTLRSYRDTGGQTWPRLAEHCAEIMAFSPVMHGVFALVTDDPDHLAAAQQMLNPAEAESGT